MLEGEHAGVEDREQLGFYGLPPRGTISLGIGSLEDLTRPGKGAKAHAHTHGKNGWR